VTDEKPIADSDDHVSEVVADDAREAKRGRYGWLSLTVAGVFGLFYAYDLWEAVSNFVELPAVYKQYGLETTDIPWWVLILGLVIPPLVFAIAFVVGRKQSVLGKALIFIVGLAVVAGLSLGVIALEAILRPELAAITTR
jgi:hypothetical protein